MFNYVQRILPVLLGLITSHVENTESSSKYIPWPNADKIVELMCPATDICDVKATIGGLSESCCSECYCGDECVNGLKCCFRNNTKDYYETCLYLSSKFNNFYGFTPIEATAISYYVVTQSPHNGCHKNRGGCDSSDTSVIYPGYSQTTKKIYFNRDCATCHGVEDFEEAFTYFFCDELGSSEALDFDEEISKFLDGDNSSLCFFSFEIRSPSGISHRACSIHETESLENFINITNIDHVSSHYSMSLDDIISACISSFFSPTFSDSKKKLYPNPFCFLLGEGTHNTEQCFQSSAHPLGIHFTVVINPEVKDDLRLDAKRQAHYRDQVCLMKGNQHERCRPVTCPIGHIFNRNGVCIFFGTRIFEKGRMNIYLNLILKRKSYNNINDSNLLNQTTDDIEIYMQLSDDWRIAFWGISVDSEGDDVQAIGDVILILELISADLPNGIDSIKRHLNKEVVILNETYTVLFYGKEFQLHEILPDDVLAVTQCSTTKIIRETQHIGNVDSLTGNLSEIRKTEDGDSTARNTNEIPQIDDNVPDCWQMIAFSVLRYNSLSVVPLSKLYFCNLVQLMTGEYRLFANDSLLYNEIGGIYLYENEFVVQHHENGKRIVKVCLTDSGLSPLATSASLKHDGTLLDNSLLLVFFTYQAYNL